MRRRNSSCDPCRRSKRRCSFPTEDGNRIGKTCVNCINLGHLCTFDFVAARVARKRQRTGSASTHTREGGRQNAGQPPSRPSNDVQSDKVTPADKTQRTDQTFESWMDLVSDSLDFDSILPDFNIDFSNLDSVVSPSSERSDESFGAAPLLEMEVVSRSSIHSRRTPPSAPQNSLCLVGSLANSPIGLLNASATVHLMNQHLMGLYDIMFNGMASRYLDHVCNIFERRHPYSFEDDKASATLLQSPRSIETDTCSKAKNSSSGIFLSYRRSATLSLCPENANSVESNTAGSLLPLHGPVRKVTLVGVARFLDNFGDLYGNVTSSTARTKSEALLEAVLHAYSAQFLRNDAAGERDSAMHFDTTTSGISPESARRDDRNIGSTIFLNAWSKAHALLLEAQSTRTFTVVISIFLYDMTVVPTPASLSSEQGARAHEFLDRGLRHLLELERLVQNHCRRLGSGSFYANLIESTMNIVRWFGYVRDTVASMMSDRPLLLPDAPYRSESFTSAGTLNQIAYSESSFRELDSRVPEICRKAAGDLFHAWRCIIRLRMLLKRTPSGVTPEICERSTSIASSTAIVDGFNLAFGPFLKHCLAEFSRLSAKSKFSSAFSIMFSSLGILSLVEQIRLAFNIERSLFNRGLNSKILNYQSEACSSIATVARYALELPGVEASRLSNDLTDGLPFASYHGNLGLVVTALVKGIEHTIDLQLSSDPQRANVETGAGQNPIMPWDKAIKSMVTCLLSLDTVVSGPHTAGTSLQNLMRQYGDILMECWSPDNGFDHLDASSSCSSTAMANGIQPLQYPFEYTSYSTNTDPWSSM